LEEEFNWACTQHVCHCTFHCQPFLSLPRVRLTQASEAVALWRHYIHTDTEDLDELTEVILRHLEQASSPEHMYAPRTLNTALLRLTDWETADGHDSLSPSQRRAMEVDQVLLCAEKNLDHEPRGRDGGRSGVCCAGSCLNGQKHGGPKFISCRIPMCSPQNVMVCVCQNGNGSLAYLHVLCMTVKQEKKMMNM
jgi:hypothetical protein